jgi:serine/threonine protein kinase/tetratricopeptide (TPR) repeat protein
MNEESLFAQALEISDSTDRSAFLNRACQGDHVLFQRIGRLLERHASAGSFLERPTDESSNTTIFVPDSKSKVDAQGTMVGPYKLIEVIGEGGMGTVYLAQQTVPVKRIVALKVIKSGMDTRQVLARFEAERQALALMDHPNIARVLDASATLDGRPYFVMELVKGVPLTRYCDDHRLLPKDRLELFVQVCYAVQHAHQKGIIHRDIKPSNVLVAPYDGKPVVKVIDFGVAKATGQPLTDLTLVTGIWAVIGTPEYMSPEQAEVNNQDIDTRSDVYSLGVLLYELLTGTTPLTRNRVKGAALLDVLRLVREDETLRPSSRLSTAEELPRIAANRGLEPRKLCGLIRGELDWIVMKSLEKERNRRYETATGLAADIERYLKNEPVLACPPNPMYRLRKFARRNKGPLMTVCLVLIALSVGLIGTVLSLVEARAQYHDAQRGKTEARDAAAEANAVLTFFEKRVLSAARPKGQGNGLGNKVTIREALDAAEPAIADAFSGQPLAEASIRRVMGLTYWHAGEYEKAVRQHERALALRRSILGDDHPNTLQSLTNLGQAYQSAGRLKDALPLQEETLKRKQSVLGPSHSDTLWAMNRLAETYMMLGRGTEALPLYEQQAAIARQTLGHDHTDTLIYMDKVAVAYRRVGRYREAITLFEETYKLYESKLPPDHHDRLATMSNLGFAYADVGRWDDSIAWLVKVLDIDKTALDEDHPERLIHLHNLGTVYRDAGRTAEALPLLEEACERHVKKMSVDHPISLFFNLNRAWLYCDLGRLDDSYSLLIETDRRLLSKQSAKHPHRLLGLNLTGTCLIKMKKYREAETLLQECLVLHVQVDPASWWVSYTKSQLGQVAFEQKQLDQAEVLLTDAYRGLVANQERMQAKYWNTKKEIAKLLVQLYDARGMKERASEWRSKSN